MRKALHCDEDSLFCWNYIILMMMNQNDVNSSLWWHFIIVMTIYHCDDNSSLWWEFIILMKIFHTDQFHLCKKKNHTSWGWAVPSSAPALISFRQQLRKGWSTSGGGELWTNCRLTKLNKLGQKDTQHNWIIGKGKFCSIDIT